MADLETRIRAANEHYDTLIKGAALLGGLNGVGVATSFALFKDYLTVPPVIRPGLFLCIFGAGLLLSILFYGSLALLKVELQQALVSEEPDFTAGLTPASTIGVVGAIGALVPAFGIAAFKLAAF